MEHSRYYNFNLPSSDVDGIADVNKLSDNFREIDRILGEDVTKQSEILQSYDPESTNPVSGAAVNEAIEESADNILFFNEYLDETISVEDELNRLENQDLAADHRILELETRADIHETELALKASTEYVDEKTEWKTLSSGTLDESTGGVAKITAALNESIEDINEFRFYLEIPTGSPTGTTTTMYVNAVIDNANPALKNCLFAVSHDGTPSAGRTTRTIAIMNVVTSPDGARYIHSVANPMTIHYGINTRGNSLSTLCLWDVSESNTNLVINISNYLFESGTKWILEGR